VWEIMTWGFSQGKADYEFRLVESGGCILCQKLLSLMLKTLF
jgi:hypothetical protein